MIALRCPPVPQFVSVVAFALATSACDSSPKPAAKPAEDQPVEVKPNKYTEKRLAEAAAKKKAEEELKTKIAEVTTIPEGYKLPKKSSQACELVVDAQRGFMKKYHPEVPDAALTTQLGMLGKHCKEVNNVKVAVCQKFALDATTEEMKGAINEYLPACMNKYGGRDKKG